LSSALIHYQNAFAMFFLLICVKIVAKTGKQERTLVSFISFIEFYKINDFQYGFLSLNHISTFHKRVASLQKQKIDVDTFLGFPQSRSVRYF